MASGIEVKPPGIGTGKTLGAVSDNERCTLDTASRMRPAAPSTKPANGQTSPRKKSSETPTDDAACWLHGATFHGVLADQHTRNNHQQRGDQPGNHVQIFAEEASPPLPM